MKKIIAFDLDGTLAPSKSPAPDRMIELLDKLLDKAEGCVISGGKFAQFEKQLLSNLQVPPEKLEHLHIMPTCGTRYFRFKSDKWHEIYAENFSSQEKQQIVTALNKGFDDLKMREEKTWGETIEDRDSQITFSVLGQDIVDELGQEGVKMKEAWDPDDKKKQRLRDYIAPLIPNFEVRVGGVTSIDVTKKGIDKAYGMRKLVEILGSSNDEVLFIGDRIREGGNDYPVKLMGIDCIQIASWQETALVVETLTLVLP
jgi:phosphomannomutase